MHQSPHSTLRRASQTVGLTSQDLCASHLLVDAGPEILSPLALEAGDHSNSNSLSEAAPDAGSADTFAGSTSTPRTLTGIVLPTFFFSSIMSTPFVRVHCA